MVEKDVKEYDRLIEKNKDKVRKLVDKLSKYNSKGKCTIGKDEDDFHHDEWDDEFSL